MSKGHVPNPLALQQHHAKQLSRICAMVDALLLSLEEDLEECAHMRQHAAMCRRREKIISALVKLSQLQMRLLPWQTDAGKEPPNELTEQKRKEYFELLARFFEKRQQQSGTHT